MSSAIKQAKPIRWDISKVDAALVAAIVRRYHGICERLKVARLPDISMDIIACHRNGCALLLTDLLAADDANFIHDIAGIHRHLDRNTGKLTDCFLPRFSA